MLAGLFANKFWPLRNEFEAYRFEIKMKRRM